MSKKKTETKKQTNVFPTTIHILQPSKNNLMFYARAVFFFWDSGLVKICKSNGREKFFRFTKINLVNIYDMLILLPKSFLHIYTNKM